MTKNGFVLVLVTRPTMSAADEGALVRATASAAMAAAVENMADFLDMDSSRNNWYSSDSASRLELSKRRPASSGAEPTSSRHYRDKNHGESQWIIQSA